MKMKSLGWWNWRKPWSCVGRKESPTEPRQGFELGVWAKARQNGRSLVLKIFFLQVGHQLLILLSSFLHRISFVCPPEEQHVCPTWGFKKTGVQHLGT